MIDIDGTVTEDVPNEEPERMATCLPFEDALETLNRWYDEGHIITFFTSRTEEHREVTETWLNKARLQVPRLADEQATWRQLPLGGQPHRACHAYEGRFTDLVREQKPSRSSKLKSGKGLRPSLRRPHPGDVEG